MNPTKAADDSAADKLKLEPYPTEVNTTGTGYTYPVEWPDKPARSQA